MTFIFFLLCAKNQSIRDLALGFVKMDLNPIFGIWIWIQIPNQRSELDLGKSQKFGAQIQIPNLLEKTFFAENFSKNTEKFLQTAIFMEFFASKYCLFSFQLNTWS